MRPLENPGRVSGHERNLKAGMHVQKRGGFLLFLRRRCGFANENRKALACSRA
jgi:hypothetical protein